MWRFLKFVVHVAMVIVAAVVSFLVVNAVALPDSHTGFGGLYNGVVAGAVGLVFGLILAWMRGVPWHRLPIVVEQWRNALRRQFWWLTAGGVSVGVLLFY